MAVAHWMPMSDFFSATDGAAGTTKWKCSGGIDLKGLRVLLYGDGPPRRRHFVASSQSGGRFQQRTREKCLFIYGSSTNDRDWSERPRCRARQ
jgi:hypothetical protein